MFLCASFKVAVGSENEGFLPDTAMKHYWAKPDALAAAIFIIIFSCFLSPRFVFIYLYYYLSQPAVNFLGLISFSIIKSPLFLNFIYVDFIFPFNLPFSHPRTIFFSFSHLLFSLTVIPLHLDTSTCWIIVQVPE